MQQLDLSSCGIREIAYLVLVIGFVWPFFFIPLFIMIWSSHPTQSSVGPRRCIYCAPFSLSSPVFRWASLPPLTHHGGGLFLLLFWRAYRMIKEGFQPAFSALTFQQSSQRPFENGPRLVATAFFDSSYGWKTLLCLLVLVAVLGGYVAYLRE